RTRISGLNDPPDLPGRSPYDLERHCSRQSSLLRHPIAVAIGAGMLTCFPSTTPFGLALGSDSPSADYRSSGNLGLSASGFFTRFNVTHVSIRTSHTSSVPRSTP